MIKFEDGSSISLKKINNNDVQLTLICVDKSKDPHTLIHTTCSLTKEQYDHLIKSVE